MLDYGPIAAAAAAAARAGRQYGPPVDPEDELEGMEASTGERGGVHVTADARRCAFEAAGAAERAELALTELLLLADGRGGSGVC